MSTELPDTVSPGGDQADDDTAASPASRVFALPGAPDATLVDAVELARAAAVEVAGEDVGEHLGVKPEAERVVTHAFAATLPGYVGWYWAVTIARASRSRTATVDEVVLLPGDAALRAPTWVPWHERVRPGDLSPGELLPTTDDDVRLVPAYTLSDDPQVDDVAFELGVGRDQVMSRDGRELAAERWYTGDRGPDTAMARQAPGHCGTCGFFLALAGSLSAGFGVCGNEVTDSDGQVVSVEYGCGAHSTTRSSGTPLGEHGEVVYDDGDEVSLEPRGAIDGTPARPALEAGPHAEVSAES
ncbi:Protein of unknown function [Jatrophihabitans endophyticus]|uniref:DUF3027 domain-containing protein n=1 Tax=Jatrophihabitans endophyticus TaxID=1206085 RepID=A0A1M5RHI6_9ACTN|nr:DUF3027 domain-containing protein [Jatrophihabitans endophyticus]SHH25616.1 Protein of unknown function [Jatrophihabitans endophyticus]